MNVLANIPESVAELLEISPSSGESSQRILEEVVIGLYLQQKVSLGKAASLLEMDRWSFEAILQARNIEKPYNLQDLEDDLRFIEEFAGSDDGTKQ